MRYSIREITPISTVTQALELGPAKAHMRVTFEDDDDDILSKIKAAQARLEGHLGRYLTPRTIELTLDAFPRGRAAIDLQRLGVTALTSAKYTDANGDEITVDPGSYRWSDADSEILLPVSSGEWPASAACEPGAVRIRFEAGYAAGEIPSDLLEALKRMTAYLYENREAAGEIPPGVERLCARYRRHPNGSAI